MNVVYLITDKITKLKYIGSKRNYKGAGTYFGSPNAKPSHPKYKLQQEWKTRTKTNPEDFIIEILYSSSDNSEDLLEIEKQYQRKYNVVKSFEFINASYSKKGFVNINGTMNGKTHSKETRELLSQRNKEQHRDKEKNKRHKEGCSKGQQRRWSNATEEDRKRKSESSKLGQANMTIETKKAKSDKCKLAAKRMHENMSEEEKKAYSHKQKESQPTSVKVSIDGKVYSSLRDASRELEIPKITIARRCRNEKLSNYFFIN